MLHVFSAGLKRVPVGFLFNMGRWLVERVFSLAVYCSLTVV